MNPEPIPCCSCWTNRSGEEMVVLISTTALPSWSATLITADSSVRLLLIGARGATTVFPVGVTLIQCGANRIVAAAPTSPPTTALITTMASVPIRRRGFTERSTGIDVDLSNFRLETGAGIEQHAPAQPDHFFPDPGGQDDVLAAESRGRRPRDILLDLVAAQLRVLVMTLLRKHQFAEQGPDQVMVGRVENRDGDRRCVG